MVRLSISVSHICMAVTAIDRYTYVHVYININPLSTQHTKNLHSTDTYTHTHSRAHILQMRRKPVGFIRYISLVRSCSLVLAISLVCVVCTVFSSYRARHSHKSI